MSGFPLLKSLKEKQMELVIELELLCGVSFGLTYEKFDKHTVTLDLIFLRLIFGYGPEEVSGTV